MNEPTDAFYQAPNPLPDGKPGDVIRSEPLDGAPAGSQAWRVLYPRPASTAAPPPCRAS
ncbi:MAG: hypothetical protein R2699_13615 [Acidimicrobiales bacterium]